MCVCVHVPEPMALPAHTADAPFMCSLVAASWRANREQPVFCLVTVNQCGCWHFQVCFKVWQRAGVVYKKNLILLSAASCTEPLRAIRIYAANIVFCASLVDGRNKAQSREVACLSSPRASSTTCTGSFISSRLHCEPQDTW